MKSTNDMVFKDPARFSLRLAFPQAILVACLLIGLAKYTEVESIFLLPIVVFLPVLSVGVFAAITRRHVYVFSKSEATLCRYLQWYWLKPRLVECHGFKEIAEMSVVRYDGEETWWLVYVLLRDGRRYELTGNRNHEKSNQVRADIEQLVDCAGS